MGRKKTPKVEEIITGKGKSPEKNIVQKANPLLSLSRSDLTLSEFKIMDAYLSRINSHEPEKRTVRLEKGEIEEYLGVTQIKTPDLKKRLAGLGKMVPVNDIDIENPDEEFRMVALFQSLHCKRDKDGIWQVDLTCTEDAMKYVFNVENFGYLRYGFRSVCNLRSRYAYCMFLYLESQRKLHLSWEVDVDELRQVLGADDEETYQQYKRFNDLILKRCQAELHEKTECRYTYEPVKKGRRIAKIRFELAPLRTKIEPAAPEPPQPDPDDDIEMYRHACARQGCEPEFDRAQIEALLQIIVTLPSGKLPPDMDGGLPIRRYHYLAQKYAQMNTRPNVKNRYNYLLKMIKQDAQQ